MNHADETALAVRRILTEVLGREHLPPHASLSALGLDSIAMVEVGVRIEAAWGIELPDLDELGRGQLDTLDELIAFVRSRRERR